MHPIIHINTYDPSSQTQIPKYANLHRYTKMCSPYYIFYAYNVNNKTQVIKKVSSIGPTTKTGPNGTPNQCIVIRSLGPTVLQQKQPTHLVSTIRVRESTSLLKLNLRGTQSSHIIVHESSIYLDRITI